MCKRKRKSSRSRMLNRKGWRFMPKSYTPPAIARMGVADALMAMLSGIGK